METFFLRFSAYQVLSTCSACRTVHSRIIVLYAACDANFQWRKRQSYLSLHSLSLTPLDCSANDDLIPILMCASIIDFSQELILKFFDKMEHVLYTEKNWIKSFILAKSWTSIIRLRNLRVL